MDSPNQHDNQLARPLIMVIDDNPEFLNGIELTLQLENFEVWTSIDGQDALDKLYKVFRAQVEDDSQLARLPDLILADIMMPAMDGYEFYEHCRKNPYLNHIPFIFLTAKGDAADIRHGKELGSDDYLPKLTPTEDILATIRGRLKRVEQQRALSKQFTWDPDRPMEGRTLILIGAVALLVAMAFCAGYFTATFFAGLLQ